MLVEALVPALIVFLLAFAGMAIGVIFSNRRITGSCGGLSAIPGASQCGICGKSANGRCTRKTAQNANAL